MVTRKTQKTTAKPAAPTRKSKPVADPPAAPEALLEQIREHAYLKAEQRGFVPGLETQDWFEAEQEVQQATRKPQR